MERRTTDDNFVFFGQLPVQKSHVTIFVLFMKITLIV